MFEELKKTYQGKKVFLTGHTGFKGSWMLAIFKLLDAKVKGYALSPQVEPALFDLINGNSLCESIIGDIRDEATLSNELLDFQPDFVFHLAAQPIVRESYNIPIETYDVNVIGTGKVLEAIRKLEKRCIVILITTDKVYENKEIEYGYKEDDHLGGYDPYSASKACAEILCSSYRRSFFHPSEFDKHLKSISTARSGNVIGGGDWATDRIVPDIARALENDETVIVRNPNSVRPWQHVLEPSSGYLVLGSKMDTDPIKYADSFNFGPNLGDNLPVEELVKLALNCWGKGNYEINQDANAVHEANLLQLSIDKAYEKLGWKPVMKSSEAIARTVEWYKNYKDDPLGITTQQIENYFNL